MFPLPTGWQVVRSQDAIQLAAPDGKVLVHEGLRSVAPIDDLVATPPVPGFQLEAGSVEHIVTCEGELGLVAAGRVDDAIFSVGLVLLDDTYTRVIGRAASAETAHVVASVVRDIVTAMRWFLGNPRRRRFRYEPPLGWRYLPKASGDETWLAPDYPAHRASLTVPRALPIAAREHVSMVKTLLGAAEGEIEMPLAAAVMTRRGLSGQHWSRRTTAPDGVELVIDVVALGDGRYDYFARSIAPRADAGVLTALLDTIEPVPLPPPAAPGAAMAHWID